MPATRWSICLAHVLAHEGGYVDHPSDPGGATNRGITRKTLARWRGVAPWWALAKSEVRDLSKAEAGSIYKARYWDRCRAGSLPAGLDLALFDFAVNSGPDRAIKALQALVGVVRDGFVGPITLGAVAQRDTRALIEALCDHRMGFLQRLTHWASFGRGWTSRVEAVRAAALADAGLSFQPEPQKDPETMNFLDGYKTYVVGALMLAVGLAQVLGVDVPALGGYSGSQLVMEALAIIFLRKGIKTDLGRA
ncbi:glycoside hydrolase family 108 protein [Pelagibacterium montanilacus]|uniref:glycoside hydrolase family 108 protein n=1 Tax=Pelagibacterium montanilacus TaxID=2185280 RepID=UPI000F8D0F41|nr:glycosyl hydrolase 108 family protein [Pelagibacterium montanilacus]